MNDSPNSPLTREGRLALPPRTGAADPASDDLAAARSALGDVLSSEVVRLERMMIRVGMWVTFVALFMCLAPLIAFWNWSGSDPMLLIALLLLPLPTLWFAFAGWAHKHGHRQLANLGILFLMCGMPWMPQFLIFDLVNPQTALASWPGQAIWMLCVVLTIAQLRRGYVVVLVASAVALQLVFFLGFVEPLVAQGVLTPSLGLPTLLEHLAVVVAVGVMAWVGVGALKATAARTAAQVRASELFGKYRLEEQVASGGMGTVHRAAYCPEGGFIRPVAIKRVREDLAANPHVVAQFRDEAELCARLAHPNIIGVLDFGRAQQTYFFAMEWVDGFDLGEVLHALRRQSRPLPIGVCGFIVAEVCRGLAYAYEEATDDEGALLRVVHRDLSPRNIMVSRAGQVKIADFGIARVLRDAQAAQTQNVVGKPAYMAPEQLKAAPFDGRVDVFALGIILWEMLAGRPLFLRSSAAASAYAVLEAEIPSIMEVREDLSPPWAALLDKALSRDPDQRFATASAMLEALEAVGRNDPGATAAALRELLATVHRRGLLAGPEESTQETPHVLSEDATAPQAGKTLRAPQKDAAREGNPARGADDATLRL